MTNRATLDTAVLGCVKCGETFASRGARANRIRNKKCCTLPERFQERLLKTPSGCLEYQGFRDGWGYAHCGVNGKRKQAHRYAYELAHGSIPAGMLVMHTCDNPPCCNLAHLRLGTTAENRADAVAKDRHARGERNNRNTLTEKQVLEIRSRYLRRHFHDTNASELAAEYGVTKGTIHGIAQRRIWKYLP